MGCLLLQSYVPKPSSFAAALLYLFLRKTGLDGYNERLLLLVGEKARWENGLAWLHYTERAGLLK